VAESDGSEESEEESEEENSGAAADAGWGEFCIVISDSESDAGAEEEEVTGEHDAEDTVSVYYS